jgi:hypothetical protein
LTIHPKAVTRRNDGTNVDVLIVVAVVVAAVMMMMIIASGGRIVVDVVVVRAMLMRLQQHQALTAILLRDSIDNKEMTL